MSDPSPSARDVTSLTMLERARVKDPDAWVKILGLYRPLVAFWCSRAGVPSADVEDVAQDVFAAAACGLDGFRRDRPGDTFRGWLRGITRNQVLMHLRRRRGQADAEGGTGALGQLNQVADPLAAGTDGEAAEVGAVYRRVLDLVRSEFEDRTWQAFWLTAVEGRLPAAVEADLGMSAAAIRQARSRVLNRLRSEMKGLIE